MTKLLTDKLFLAYAALLGITGLSFFAGRGALLAGEELGAALLLLAFIKARLIVVHFMEARVARLPIRLAFEGWIFAVAVMTIGLYLR